MDDQGGEQGPLLGAAGHDARPGRPVVHSHQAEQPELGHLAAYRGRCGEVEDGHRATPDGALARSRARRTSFRIRSETSGSRSWK